MFRLKKSVNLAKPTSLVLSFQCRSHFNDLLKQPLHSFSLNSMINLNIELLKQLQSNFGSNWTTAIILMSGGLRIFLAGTNHLISKKLELKYPERGKIWKDIQEKALIKDFEKTRDFYTFKETEIINQKRYYKLNDFVSTGFSGFMLLNWFRALHYVCYNHEFFQSISTERILNGFSLVGYDPYFILPIITFIFNYATITGSNHPFLNIFNHGKNPIKRFNKILLLSLPSMFFPSAYLISWCSFLATHLVVKNIQKISDNMNQKANLKKYTLSLSKKHEMNIYYQKIALKSHK